MTERFSTDPDDKGITMPRMNDYQSAEMSRIAVAAMCALMGRVGLYQCCSGSVRRKLIVDDAMNYAHEMYAALVDEGFAVAREPGTE